MPHWLDLSYPAPQTPAQALYLLWLGGFSTRPAAISEARMLDLHLPGARKSKKEGRGGSNQKMELNQGEQVKREAGAHLDHHVLQAPQLAEEQLRARRDDLIKTCQPITRAAIAKC